MNNSICPKSLIPYLCDPSLVSIFERRNIVTGRSAVPSDEADNILRTNSSLFRQQRRYSLTDAHKRFSYTYGIFNKEGNSERNDDKDSQRKSSAIKANKSVDDNDEVEYKHQSDQPQPQQYPHFTYLDLREKQNTSHAESSLKKAVDLIKSKQFFSAERLLKQILGYYPNHANALVTYGALCANSIDSSSSLIKNRHDEAIRFFNKALDIDPNCPNGARYKEIELKREAERKRSRGIIIASSSKASSSLFGTNTPADRAMQDVKAEMMLAGAATDSVGGASVAANVLERYPLLTEPEVELPTSYLRKTEKQQKLEDENFPSSGKKKKKKRHSEKEDRRSTSRKSDSRYVRSRHRSRSNASGKKTRYKSSSDRRRRYSSSSSPSLQSISSSKSQSNDTTNNNSQINKSAAAYSCSVSNDEDTNDKNKNDNSIKDRNLINGSKSSNNSCADRTALKHENDEYIISSRRRSQKYQERKNNRHSHSNQKEKCDNSSTTSSDDYKSKRKKDRRRESRRNRNGNHHSRRVSSEKKHKENCPEKTKQEEVVE